MITLDANHVYHDEQGRKIPGVTGIIRACGLMDEHGWNDYARDRGSAVHKAVELYECGTLDDVNLDPVIVPYLDAYKSFQSSTGWECLEVEKIIYHKTFRYAGTLDQIGTMNGRSCVLDLKTGALQRWWAIQTAAYNAVEKQQDRYSLELRGDGKWKLTQHKDKNDIRVFQACLTVAGWKAAT